MDLDFCKTQSTATWWHIETRLFETSLNGLVFGVCRGRGGGGGGGGCCLFFVFVFGVFFTCAIFFI